MIRLRRKICSERSTLRFSKAVESSFMRRPISQRPRHVYRQGEDDFQADPDTFRNQIRQDFFQIHISDFFDRFREFGFLYAVRNDEFFGLLCCDEKKSHERIKFDRLELQI